MSHTDLSDLRTRRKALGISQRDLAQRARCSDVSISLLERGRVPTRSATLRRILATLRQIEEQA